MKSELSAIILSSLAAICFFVTYFLNKETLNLVLGCTWFVIAIGSFANYKKNRK